MKIISSSELKQLLDSGADVALIDVRQPEEVIYGAPKGTVLIPMGEVPGRVEEIRNLLGEDASRKGIVFCRVGGRSENVIRFLEGQGVRELYNLVGGMNAYAEVDESVIRY